MPNHNLRTRTFQTLQVTSLAAAALLIVLPGVATAAPNPADIALGLTADPNYVAAAGGRVSLTVSARNVGGTNATDTPSS
jgi:hypothetical protein